MPIKIYQIKTRLQNLKDESKSKMHDLTLEKYTVLKCVNTLNTPGSFRLQSALIFLQDFHKYSAQDRTSPQMEAGTNNLSLFWSSWINTFWDRW